MISLEKINVFDHLIDTNHVTDESRSVKLANTCGNYIPIMRIIPNNEKNENKTFYSIDTEV